MSPPQLQMMNEREAQEVALFGEVLIWSPDRIMPDSEEVVEENRAVTEKPKIDNPFLNVVIPETEPQTSQQYVVISSTEELAIGEGSVGR